MTVKQLIKELQKYDEDFEVEIYATYDCGYAQAGGKIEEVSGECATVYLENNEG